jgi:hypothetical protein
MRDTVLVTRLPAAGDVIQSARRRITVHHRRKGPTTDSNDDPPPRSARDCLPERR